MPPKNNYSKNVNWNGNTCIFACFKVIRCISYHCVVEMNKYFTMGNFIIVKLLNQLNWVKNYIGIFVMWGLKINKICFNVELYFQRYNLKVNKAYISLTVITIHWTISIAYMLYGTIRQHVTQVKGNNKISS